MQRVAHFLQNPNLLGSPPNDALVAAYRSLGCEIDIYSTWTDKPAFDEARLEQVEYSARWLIRNALRPSWRRYALFSATTEDPTAIAGVIAQFWRRPLVTLADEIRTGSYSGNRGRRWKNLCRWGMRRADLTIVNEEERVGLQKDYAQLPHDAPVLVYPGSFRQPPSPAERNALRESRRIPSDALVLCYSGMISHDNGGIWIAEALRKHPDVWVWGQIVNLDPMTLGLLQRIHGHERLVLEQARLSWREAWSSMAAADIGAVIYLQNAPQFRHMGTASNRLCMFLAMGVPVIASRQPSFEFIERFDCGVLIDGPEEIAAAIDGIAARLDSMRTNAITCSREYIRPHERWTELREALGQMLLR